MNMQVPCEAFTWKIPAPHNIADNFWRPGNLLAALDRHTGEVKRVTTNVGYNNKIGPGPGWKRMPVPDGFDYAVTTQDELIVVEETEILTIPCFCLCCYSLPALADVGYADL